MRIIWRATRTTVLAALFLVASTPSMAAPDPGAVQLVDAYPSLSFDKPVYMTYAPDGSDRMFVITQRGTIQVFVDDPATTQTKMFLDLSVVVSQRGNETGLLGLAFDPAYAENGRFYVNYTTGDGRTVPFKSYVSRYTVSAADPDVADPASQKVLLSVDQPESNHNGGWLGFGQDGYLYIAFGDGGGSGDPDNNAQNLGTVLGKILRIKANGKIPSDNPFYGVQGARQEIWAYGFRNPYRASFDRNKGKLWVGEVGQDEWEEIDLIKKGKNYGWRKYEGTHVYNETDPEIPDAVFPKWEYDHSGGACSVIGGYVYRGSAIAGLGGDYLYADYCAGTFSALDLDGTTVLSSVLMGEVPGSPTSFSEGPDGELYIVAFDGKIYRIAPAN